MLDIVNSMSDRLLSAFLPKATAGACPCGYWDNGWYYYCYQGTRWKHYCVFTCNCSVSCSQNQSTGLPCDV